MLVSDILARSVNSAVKNGTRQIQGRDAGKAASVGQGNAAPSAAAASAAAAASDSVVLTDGAKKLRKLAEKLRDEPDVDESRVSELKSAVNDGTYKVDGYRVAGSMLDFEKDLAGLFA